MKSVARWAAINLVLAQLWVLAASSIMVRVFDTDVRLFSQDFLDSYLDVSVLAALGYIPYLAIIFLLPRGWSATRRRVLAVILSPLVGLWMFLPPFMLLALIYGALVVLPPTRRTTDVPAPAR